MPSNGHQTNGDTDKDNKDETPFWNMNIPKKLHTPHCPPFLEYAFENDKDREILSMPDNQYTRLSWPQVQEIIKDNRIDKFVRAPSDLRRYREFNVKLADEYGSVMDFVVKHRLQWKETEPSITQDKQDPSLAKFFKDESNWKILFNDWPYGLDRRIVHLVVWTKFDLVEDEETGELKKEARRDIDAFVEEKFTSVVGEENVIWFKNWSSLKSIHSVEHFHVMLFDPDSDFIKRITNGDVALADKVGKPTPT